MAKPRTKSADLGPRFRRLREKLGKTQDQVADAGGIQRPEVSNVESGRNQVSTSRMVKAMALGLGVSEEQLVAFRDGQLSIEELVADGSAPSETPSPRRTRPLARIVEREELPAADARDRVIDALLADGVTDDAGVAYQAVRSVAFQNGDELALYREARKLIEREQRPDKPRLGERSAKPKAKP